MPLSDYRILIVEDDFIISEHIAEVVRGAGGRVVGPFPDMIQALDRLNDLNGVDVAVLDVGLGSGTSYPIASAFQSTRTPFLFLTGMDKQDMPSQFARCIHMKKPFTASALVLAIAECAAPG